MSIATQISALTNDRAAIRSALVARGVAAASGHGFDSFAADIAAIPSGGSAYAFLIVSYPAGASVTCTNTSGSKTLGEGRALFYVNDGNSCVATITQEGRTRSSDAVSLAEGESRSIALSFEFVIYENGVINSAFSSSLSGYGTRWASGTATRESPPVSYGSTQLEIGWSSKVGRAGMSYFTPMVGPEFFEGYEKICVTALSTRGSQAQFFLCTSLHDTNISAYTEGSAAITSGSFTTLEIPTSGVDASCYISFFVGASTSAANVIKVSRIWME